MDVVKVIDKRRYDLGLPKKPKPPRFYTQDWPSYNMAQTNEKLMFLEFLRSLVDSVDIPIKKERGRNPLDPKDMLFSLCLATYNGKSSRRATSELELAKDLGFIFKKPHFNTLLNYFQKDELNHILKKIITISSLPLKVIERDFTVDASGFSTTEFGRWFDHKWGKDKVKRKWIKAHVMSGVKTNIITSVEVTEGHVSDTRMFEPLVDRTAENFYVAEVSADKAYLSRKNLEKVASYNAVPFIPFKKSSKGNSRGSYIWSKMYEYFWLKEEEFMEHYHKRSNSETVFAMMKRKFSPKLRTKNLTSQTNELLCMAICHNICVLIQEMFELGIEIDFEKCAVKGVAQNR